MDKLNEDQMVFVKAAIAALSLAALSQPTTFTYDVPLAIKWLQEAIAAPAPDASAPDCCENSAQRDVVALASLGHKFLSSLPPTLNPMLQENRYAFADALNGYLEKYD